MTDRAMLQNAMRDVFNNPFKEAVKESTYIRNTPQTSTPSTTEPYFDPVTETWINPPSEDPVENPDKISKQVSGIYRRIKSSIMDRFSLSNSDRQFTMDYDHFKEAVGSYPAIDDVLENPEEGSFRVVGWEKDSMDVFIKIYLRRNP